MILRLSRRSFILGLALTLCSATGVIAQTVSRLELTLLHTNDTHGHLRPYSYPDTFDRGSDLARLSTRTDIGGAARRATLVQQIRREKGRETFLLDAGDIMDGTPFSTEFKGEADIAVMNAMGYDFACPGNHEFNNAFDQVLKLKREAKFPVLCANIVLKDGGQLLYSPFAIKEIQGVKIAFFGLTTPSGQTYPGARETLVIQDPVAVAKKLVPELRKQADFVIAITHIGLEEDRKLAVAVSGINVIVGGHSHTMLPNPLFIGERPGTNPLSVNGTIIVQNFQWAATLGRLDLSLGKSPEGDWAVNAYKGALLPITSKIPESPDVAEVVGKYWNPIAAKFAEVIGQAGGDFTKKGDDYAEYHLVADAVRAEMKVEFDIENMGGVRAPIAKGKITFEDMVSIDPFGNTIVTFSATGKQLKEILSRGRPAVSGVRYKMDSDKLIESTINGQPIEDDRVYKGCTNNYYAARAFMKPLMSDVLVTSVARRDILMNYIRKQKTVSPSYDGRRVLRNMDIWGREN